MKPLNEILDEFFRENQKVAKEFMNDDYYEGDGYALPSGVTYTEVDSYGGEDMGSDYWSVYRFENADEEVYIKFQGWYASHYGSEFQEYFFVSPAKKEVTVYV